MTFSRTLYLPIETKAREYQGKLLLAMHAARAGFAAVIGGHLDVSRNITRLPKGIVVERTLNTGNLRLLRRARMAGQRVTAWCEEGISIFDHKQYGQRRIDPRSMAEVDLFFAWGRNQAEAVELRTPWAADRIVLTGNPRFDLLREPYRQRFAPDVAALQEQYGPYILCNTSFGIFNNICGEDYFLERMRRKPEDASPEFMDFQRGWHEHVRQTFHAFVELIPRLSEAFPQHTIVIRPHPSENIETWREKTRHLPNVAVVYEGPAVPWIMGAQAMLHNNCTTGVEGYMLGRPVISYRPVVNDAFEQVITKAVSLHAFSAEEVVAQMQTALDAAGAQELDVQAQKVVDHFITGQQGPFACQTIVAALGKLARDIESGAAPDALPWSRRTLWRAKDAVRRGRILAGRLRGRGQEFEQYSKHKFSGLDVDEIRQDMKLFAELDPLLDAPDAPLQAHELPDAAGCFCISQQAPGKTAG